jgi:hypothetical protein
VGRALSKSCCVLWRHKLGIRVINDREAALTVKLLESVDHVSLP